MGAEREWPRMYSFVAGKRSYIVYTCGFVSKLEMDFTFNPAPYLPYYTSYTYMILSLAIVEYYRRELPIHSIYYYYYIISIKS